MSSGKFSQSKIASFRRLVRRYYRAHKRDFPWRRTRDPYRILVSEIMLQQTQTDRVIPKYGSFLRRFPTFKALRRASQAAVLGAWQGLGYNRRALYLKKAARTVFEEYDGRLPKDAVKLTALPGIGKGTAGAVLAFAFNMPAVFIETNIRRAFIHHFFARARKVRDEDIFRLIEATLDTQKPREWYYALMDYGAMLGKKEKRNPNRKSSVYRRQSAFKGSVRELRGRILRVLLRKKRLDSARLGEMFGMYDARLRAVIEGLKNEGFIVQRGERIYLAR